MKIRVRGWHTGQKKMFSPEEMAADQLTLLPTGEFVNVHSTSTKLSTIFPVDKFIPLLSTGLHDKNGREIWEGDIVQFVGISPSKLEIYWSAEKGRFLAGVKNNDILSDWPFVTLLEHRCEVLGNIYENGEAT